MARFTGVIRIDLAAHGEKVYQVPGNPDRLWLAKYVVYGGVVKSNPVGPAVAIRIDDRSNDQTPWAIVDGYMNSFSAPFTRLLVTVLDAGGATEMFLNTGTGVAAGHCNADGLSPIVGVGSSAVPTSGGAIL